MDNSWFIQWDDTSFLIDPWLSGSEVDGFSWFNEQWHATKPIPYGEVNPFNLVIISQGYADHCHLETLHQLGDTYQIAAVPSAFKKLRKEITNPLYVIPSITEQPLHIGELIIYRIIPDKIVATFSGIIIQKGKEYILMAPHGGPFKNSTLRALNSLTCKCLITTFTLYQLPLILGGKINPGKNAAIKLMEQTCPEFVLNTHDEDKPAKGISNKLARRIYPDFKDEMPTNFKNINHYHPVQLV